jgi:hypothetical protein
MLASRRVYSLLVAFLLLATTPLDVFADCPPQGCPKPAPPQRVVPPTPKKQPQRPAQTPQSAPRDQRSQDAPDAGMEEGGPPSRTVDPGSPLELLLDPESKRVDDYLHSPQFQEDAATATDNDLEKQIAALRQYERELLKERTWNESRRAYAGVVMAGKRVTGPASAYMDKNGQPLPDQQVIGPDQIDAHNVHRESGEAVQRIDAALHDLRKQIAALEARLARRRSQGRRPPAPPETYLSPGPAGPRAPEGGRSMGPVDDF